MEERLGYTVLTLILLESINTKERNDENRPDVRGATAGRIATEVSPGIT